MARIDAWQRRHRRAAFVVAVVKKFGDDRASSFASLIAYYAFLSLFPLLLAAEVNVVRLRRLWPRSLTGALEPADRRAMRRFAAAVRQDRRQLVSVAFSDERGED